MDNQSKHKEIALAAFEAAFNQRDPAAAERYWSPGYIQHSAIIAPGRDGLFALIASMPPGARYDNSLIMAEGDYVMMHGRYSGLATASMVAVDIFRMENGLFAEHWDVLQEEATRASSLSGLPMFGDQFPS